MSVTIKSEKEIELMREAGRILAIVHEELRDFIRPGISTMDIDKKGYEIIKSFGCIPSFLNYNGYPASICVSVNDEVVHGIPNKKRILMEGDILMHIPLGADHGVEIPEGKHCHYMWIDFLPDNEKGLKRLDERHHVTGTMRSFDEENK